MGKNSTSPYTISTHKKASVAELFDSSLGAQCWNLGFVRNFNDWEVEEVNNLYTKLENIWLRDIILDFIIRKPAKHGNFTVNSCYSIMCLVEEGCGVNFWENHIPLRVSFVVLSV